MAEKIWWPCDKDNCSNYRKFFLLSSVTSYRAVVAMERRKSEPGSSASSNAIATFLRCLTCLHFQQHDNYIEATTPPKF